MSEAIVAGGSNDCENGRVDYSGERMGKTRRVISGSFNNEQLGPYMRNSICGVGDDDERNDMVITAPKPKVAAHFAPEDWSPLRVLCP